MAEYLSKETLQEKLNRKKAGPANKRYTEGWNDAILMVKSMIHGEKPADVAPVVHGRWIDGHDYIKCSECGIMAKWDSTFFNDIGDWNYCPNCGAKMDGEN